VARGAHRLPAPLSACQRCRRYGSTRREIGSSGRVYAIAALLGNYETPPTIKRSPVGARSPSSRSRK
jgi:hypothetical protein